MALNDDSKLFAVLKQNSEDFLTQFENDLQRLRSSFSSKISDLLCDPDSLLSGDTKRLNAHLEFSKAKYDIFIGMKNLVESLSKQWDEQLGQMMSTFMENIEIFIAGTKLSVSLPTKTEISKLEKRRSPEALKKSKDKASVSPKSSLYPKIITNVLNLWPNNKEDESDVVLNTPETLFKQNRRSPKQVTIVTPEEMQARNSFFDRMESNENNYESDQEASNTPTRRGRSHASNTMPVSQTKQPARSSLRKTALTNYKETSEYKTSNLDASQRGRVTISASTESSDSSSSDDKSAKAPSRRNPSKRNAKDVSTNNTKADVTDEEEEPIPIVEVRGRMRSKSQNLNSSVSKPVLTPSKRNRKGRVAEGTLLDMNMDEEVNTPQEFSAMCTPKTSKSVKFLDYSVGMDVNEELEIYTPEVTLTRSAPRRKTTYNQTADDFADLSLTPVSIKGRGKRKTIASSVAEESAAPSPKRLKRGSGRSSIVPPKDDSEDDNLLDSDSAADTGNYSSWMSLGDISAKVPAQPGIYELKVSAAKKPAYIGACESLRQKLTLHKLKHGSGHKHLDKYIERNAANILARYEPLPNLAKAKEEENARVRAFVAQYKTTPAYN